MRIYCLLLVGLLFFNVNGQVIAQVSFVTKVSANVIGKNDQLEVSYEVINGTIETFSDPIFRSWQIVGGPNVSSSTIITNGERTTSMSYQFVLKPASPGLFVVPGATAIINGKQVTSKALSVTVTKNSSEASAGSQGSNVPDPLFLSPPDLSPPPSVYENYDGYLLQDGEDILSKTKKNLFVLVNVSKKTCYPGEAIKAEYELYSRVNLDAHITKRPSFSGFSSIDLPDYSHGEYRMETRNGKVFKVYPIRSVQLYPLQTGVQKLQPVEIETTIQYQRIPTGYSNLPYNPYAAGNTISYPYMVSSEPVPVNVLPFPEGGKPADFNGITGHFKISAKAAERKLALSEAGSLIVEIEGSGNWAMVQQPTINWPEGVDVFEPVITESLDSQSVPLTGRRTYEFPYSSSKAGKITTPAIAISFFDPEKKAYQVVSTKSNTVTILKQRKPVSPLPGNKYGGLSGQDNTQIFTDIVKIAFPITAALLLLWLLIKNRRKKENNRQEARYKKQYDERASKHEETLEKQLKIPVLQPYQPTPDLYNFPPRKNEDPQDNKNVLVEKTTPVNEHAGIPFTTSKSYFSVVKKDVLQLLQKHAKLSGQAAPINKTILVQEGFSEDEVQKILSLLQLCERHIYSPFNEEFDQPSCNQMLTEITTIISNKRK